MRLCVNCKFYKQGVCYRQKSPVDGGALSGWRGNPELQREDSFFLAYLLDICGKSGRWFEPKHDNKE